MSVLGTVVAFYFGWERYCWDTVCTAHSPDGGGKQ
jgi:hypothetical protein